MAGKIDLLPMPLRRYVWIDRNLCLLAAMVLACLTSFHWGSADEWSRPVTPVAIAKPLDSPPATQDLEALARSDHSTLLKHCIDNYRHNFRDYTCTFAKQERIRGVLGKPQEIRVRFRQLPFSVAMEWVSNPPIADRVLYVEGQNDGQMLVRPSSTALQFLSPAGFCRKPDDEQAKSTSLRTVNLFGFERAMQSLLDVYQQGGKNGDLKQDFGGYFKVAGRDTLLLVRYLANRNRDYAAYKTNIYIDVEHLVPVMVEAFGWDSELLYRYEYSNVAFNVALSENSFTPESIGLKK